MSNDMVTGTPVEEPMVSPVEGPLAFCCNVNVPMVPSDKLKAEPALRLSVAPAPATEV